MPRPLTTSLLLGAGAAAGFALARRAPPKLDHGDAIIAHAAEAIISTDHAGEILIANDAAAALFGTSADAMSGMPLARYLTPSPLQDGEPAPYFGDSARVGRRATDHVVSGIRADGSTFALEGSSSCVMEDGRPIHTIIVRDISGRQQVQDKLSRSHTQLRQLSSALLTIREQERSHIARELHDDLGQLLATLRLDLTLLRNHCQQSSAGLIDGMENNLMMAISSLRRIASNLRPLALDDGGLYFALQGLRDQFKTRYGIACTLYADEAELRLGDSASTAIYRIVQEALTNIARHAEAANVTITLYRVDHQVLLTVRDDGRGIQPGDMDKAASMGLLGMRERVLDMNGDISINSDEPHGTRIDIVLPLLVRTD